MTEADYKKEIDEFEEYATDEGLNEIGDKLLKTPSHQTFLEMLVEDRGTDESFADIL